MAQQNTYDFVVDELHKIRQLVRAELSRQYKKQKPFREEEVKPEDRLYWYEQFNQNPNAPELMGQLIAEKGRDKVNEWIGEMEQLKGRIK